MEDALDQPGILLLAGAHGEIEALLDDIHPRIAEMHIEGDARVFVQKGGEFRRQRDAPEGRGNDKAHQPARRGIGLPHPGLGLIEIGEDRHRGLVEGLAMVGQGDAAGGAGEELSPQMGLQRRDVLGDRRR